MRKNEFLKENCMDYLFPRETVKYPPLEILKSKVDVVHIALILVALLEQGVRPDDLQRSLPMLAVL